MNGKQSDFNRKIFHLFKDEHSRRPKAEVSDYFKLLYQSVFGMEHLVDDEQKFREAFEREMALTTPDASLPLIEPITLVQPIARINFGPAIDMEISSDIIQQICMESIKMFQKIDTDLFSDLYALFHVILKSEPFSISEYKISRFLDSYPAENWPPIHHSSVYRDLYSPHYRLVNPDIIDKFIEFV